jgi:hypothetical protein
VIIKNNASALAAVLLLMLLVMPCAAESIADLQDTIKARPAIAATSAGKGIKTRDGFQRHHVMFGGGATIPLSGPQHELMDSAGLLSDYVLQYRYSVNRRFDIVADARTYGNYIKMAHADSTMYFGGSAAAVGLRYNLFTNRWKPFLETDAVFYSSTYSGCPGGGTPTEYKNKIGLCAKTGIQVAIYGSLSYQFELFCFRVATPVATSGYGIASCFGLDFGKAE